MSIITRFADDSHGSFLQQYEAFQISRIGRSPNTYAILQIGIDKGENRVYAKQICKGKSLTWR